MSIIDFFCLMCFAMVYLLLFSVKDKRLKALISEVTLTHNDLRMGKEELHLFKIFPVKEKGDQNAINLVFDDSRNLLLIKLF